MSRSELPVTTDTHDPRNGSPSTPERSLDASSRIGISREAAKAEMERFRGVAEYETRKLFGERTALRQPMEPLQTGKKSRRRTAHDRPSEVRSTHTQVKTESPEGPKTTTVKGPARTEE